MRIFIMRHGHRADDPTNPNGVQIPAGRPLDPDLSSIGMEMARQTADLLRPEGVQFVYASPFLRTTRTAAIIAQELNLRVRLDWGFCEHLVPQWFMDWPGTLAPQELARRFPVVDPYFEQTGVLPNPPEDYWEMHDRSMRAVKIMETRHPKDAILIVTHAAVACTVPPGLVGWDGWNGNPQLCAVTSMTKTEFGWKLNYGGRVDHLKVVRA